MDELNTAGQLNHSSNLLTGASEEQGIESQDYSRTI